MKNISIAFGIFLSCMTGLLYAQSLTQAVNNQVSNDQNTIQTLNAEKQELWGRIKSLDAQINAAEADENGYTAIAPDAVTADQDIQAQAIQAQQASPGQSMQVQGTVNTI